MATAAEKVRRHRERRKHGLSPMVVAVPKSELARRLTEIGLLPEPHKPDEMRAATERLLEIIAKDTL